MLGLLSFLYLCICVFVYLCISHLIHGNVIIDILESRAFKKYRFFLVLETSPEFWQMSNMEYLHWGYGVCRYVLSIEYDHGIFALGVCDMHHHHCWDGGQIDQGG